MGVFFDFSLIQNQASFRRFKRDVLGIKQERNDQSNAGELDELMSKYKIGSRCEVGSKGEFPKRGEILYVGPLEGLSKYWIGVKLDEPFGKNDGSVKGKRYFDAGGPKYGSFSRPEDVNVGDFPPLDDFEDDSDEEL